MSRAGTIDGPRFAVEREVITGALAIADLPRLADITRVHAQDAFPIRRECRRDSFLDRHRQHETVVVIRVLADEVHAAGREGDARRRHTGRVLECRPGA